MFRTFKVSTVKVMSFYAMTLLRANCTIIPIKKRLVGAVNLLVQKSYVKWSAFCKEKALL